VPLISTLYRGNGCVPVPRERSAWWVGPWNHRVQELHDLPLWKQALRLVRVGELQGAQQETLRFKFGSHANTLNESRRGAKD
jgi:hypothetical protein